MVSRVVWLTNGKGSLTGCSLKGSLVLSFSKTQFNRAVVVKGHQLFVVNIGTVVFPFFFVVLVVYTELVV